MRKEVAIVDLLVELFPTPERLRRFLYFSPTGSSIVSKLPEGGAMRSLAHEAVDELRRRGSIDAEFFDLLLEERPDASARIEELRGEWLVDLEDWGEPPPSEEGPEAQDGAPSVFVSYSRRDSEFFHELAAQLTLLQRKGIIRFWHEGRIRAGEEWERVLRRQTEQARIILLLVSADFLASDFIWELEFREALARHERGEATLIPIIVRPCPWQETPIASLQVLPPNGRPVAMSPDTDRVWIEVANRVAQVARHWKEAA